MRVLFLILCLYFLSECKEKVNTNVFTFYTQDSKYQISLIKPSTLDTFYQWVHYSDNTCSHEMKYRFSEKKFQIVKETSFLTKETMNSSSYFTILHTYNYKCKNPNDDSLFSARNIMEHKKELAYMRGDSFEAIQIIDTLINDAEIRFLKYRQIGNSNSKASPVFIEAFIEVDSIILKVIINCMNSNDKEFQEEAIKSIFSLNLKKTKER